MYTPIRGEIAEIIDEYTVVLNIGHNDGVRKGMKFVVYAETGHVTDPHSGKDLGVLEVPKAEVEVIDAQASLAIAETTSTKTVASWFEASRTISYTEELNVDKAKIKRVKQRVDMKVSPGDKVRQVL